MKQELLLKECETVLDTKKSSNDLDTLKIKDLYNDSYNLLMNLNMEVSDVASIRNMERGLEHVKNKFVDNNMEKDINITLGMANTLMLRLDAAKDYFMKADANEKLEETFILAQKYGRFKLVKEFLDYGKKTGDSRFTIEKNDYLEFLKTRAIQHIPLYRDGTDFSIDKNDLEEILNEYESVYNSIYNSVFDNNLTDKATKGVDKEKLVLDMLINLETKGNLNTPKKLFLADYCQDYLLSYKNLIDYDVKKQGIRKNIDSLVDDYCKKNNLEMIKKIQDGDSDDFFPISSSLYLVEDSEKHKIVLKENLKLYVDFSRIDGYNMEKEIYEQIKNDDSESSKGIVKYLGAVDLEGVDILKLEYFDGEKLSKYTNKRKDKDASKNLSSNLSNTLKITETVGIVRKVADIINYLHSNDIIYSDIKDTNILYNRETHDVKLLDFGMARLFSEHITDATEGQSLLSTPKYVPPETGTQFKFSKKSDVFQLGILFYEMITGYHPFCNFNFKEGDNYRESEIIKYSLANITQEPNLNHEELYQNNDILPLLMKSLEKDPLKRISMTEFYSEIKKIEEDIHEKQ